MMPGRAAVGAGEMGVMGESNGQRGAAPGGWTLYLVWVVLGVWSVCLWVISGQALGCTWRGMMETAAAELLALGIALAAPGVFVNVMFTAAMLLRPGKTLAMRVLLASPRSGPTGRAKAPLRVLAMAAVACAIGGLVSTFGVATAGAWMRRLGTLFVYPAWMWSLVRLAVAVALMLPLAAGAAGVVLVGLLLRRRGPGDDGGQAAGEMLAGSATGLAVAAGVWWTGVNLLTVAFGCAGALVVAAMISGVRGIEPTGGSSPVGTGLLDLGRRRQRWANIVIVAGIAWAVGLQTRALRDVLGGDWSWSWLWLAGSAAGVALTWIWQVRRRVEFHSLDAAGAALGAAVTGATAAAGIVFAVGRGTDKWIWLGGAMATSLPFTVLAGMATARRRQLFIESGHSPRLVLVDAAVGCAVGLLAALWMLTWPTTGRTIIVAALVVMTIIALAGARVAGRHDPFHTGGHLPWAATAAALIVAVALVCLVSVQSARRRVGEWVSVGASLTAVQTPSGELVTLPVADGPAGSGELTQLARRMISARAGRWWVAPGTRAAMAEDLGDGVRATVFLPDPSMRRLPVLGGVGERTHLPHVLATGTQLLDGVYLCGPGAGEAEAWCVYNVDVLRQLMDRLTAEGVMLLHLSAAADELGPLMAAARAFSDSAGDATAAVRVSPGGVEMLLSARSLLAGGEARALPPAEMAMLGASGVAVVPLGDLLAGIPGEPATAPSPLAPRRRKSIELTLGQLSDLLRPVATTRPQ